MARYRTEVYRDRRGEFRWRSIAPNGQVVVSSSEGFKRRAGCVNNVIRAGVSLRMGAIVDLTKKKPKASR